RGDPRPGGAGAGQARIAPGRMGAGQPRRHAGAARRAGASGIPARRSGGRARSLSALPACVGDPRRTRPARPAARSAAHARPQAAGRCAGRCGSRRRRQCGRARGPAPRAGGSARVHLRPGAGHARRTDGEEAGGADRGAVVRPGGLTPATAARRVQRTGRSARAAALILIAPARSCVRLDPRMTFVHAAVSHGLEHWLASPEAKAIAPALRETLRRVAAGLDPAQCAPASPAVLADTLASLALLEADGDSLAAALLFELPG